MTGFLGTLVDILLLTPAGRMLPPALAAHMGKATGLSKLAVPVESVELDAKI